MKTPVEKSRIASKAVTEHSHSDTMQSFQFKDQRPEAAVQVQLQALADKSPRTASASTMQAMSHVHAQNLAASQAPVQLMRYQPQELPVPDVNYSTLSWKGYTLPKRMTANNLNVTKNIGSESKIDKHSMLWQKISTDNKGVMPYVDGHMLNHKLGGADQPPNLVPISPDANHQMSHFEGYVIDKLNSNGGNNTYEVVDMEVSANYGRSNGDSTAENGLPQSLDMRMTPQKKENGSWEDDGRTLTQNVRVDLAPKAQYKKVQKEEAKNGQQRNFMQQHFNIQAPAVDPLDEAINAEEENKPADKNELNREHNTLGFTQTPRWINRVVHPNEGNIVSDNVQDPAWRKYQQPYAVVTLDNERTGGIGYIVEIEINFKGGAASINLESNRPWQADEITEQNIRTLITSAGFNFQLTHIDMEDEPDDEHMNLEDDEEEIKEDI